MNYYSGLAKRYVKYCFTEVKPTQVFPVTYLEPLDASKIIKQEVKDIKTNKLCFALSDAHERLFKPKPLSDEEAQEALVAWVEAKAKEKETASQTDTDESYDSDDSEFGVPTQPVDKWPKSGLFAGPNSDNEDVSHSDEPPRWSEQTNVVKMEDWAEAAMTAWAAAEEMAAVEWAVAAAMAAVEMAVSAVRAPRRGVAATIIQAAARGRAVRAWSAWNSSASANGLEEAWEAVVTWEPVVTWEAVVAWAEAKAQEREVAATIIQASARGRALRAWKAQFTDELAIELEHIYRSRYLLTKQLADVVALEQQFAKQWVVSRKYVRGWIKLADRRRVVIFRM